MKKNQRDLLKKKEAEIDLSRYLLFDDAAAFLGISRRSFATKLTLLRDHWRIHDAMLAARVCEWRLALEIYSESCESVDRRFGAGTRDFPRPIRICRRFYFERAMLIRYRELNAGRCPLP